MTQTKFFLMMYGGLFLTVIVFSIVAFFIITRPNFKVHTLEGSAGTDQDQAESAQTKTLEASAEVKAAEPVSAGDSGRSI